MRFRENIDTETEFKKSSLNRVYAPEFQPVGDLIKTGIRTTSYHLVVSSSCVSWTPTGAPHYQLNITGYEGSTNYNITGYYMKVLPTKILPDMI